MSEFREQAVREVAQAIGDDAPFVGAYASMPNDDDDYGKAVAYAVSQREGVLTLEAAIREALLHLDPIGWPIVKQNLERTLKQQTPA